MKIHVHVDINVIFDDNQGNLLLLYKNIYKVLTAFLMNTHNTGFLLSDTHFINDVNASYWF